jgi:hypothetical protein
MQAGCSDEATADHSRLCSRCLQATVGSNEFRLYSSNSKQAVSSKKHAAVRSVDVEHDVAIPSAMSEPSSEKRPTTTMLASEKTGGMHVGETPCIQENSAEIRIHEQSGPPHVNADMNAGIVDSDSHTNAAISADTVPAKRFRTP